MQPSSDGPELVLKFGETWMLSLIFIGHKVLTLILGSVCLVNYGKGVSERP